MHKERSQSSVLKLRHTAKKQPIPMHGLFYFRRRLVCMQSWDSRAQPQFISLLTFGITTSL